MGLCGPYPPHDRLSVMARFDPAQDIPTPRRRGCGGVFFCVMLVVGAGWGAALGVFVWVLEDAKTTIAALEDFRPKIGTKVYSADGELLGEFSNEEKRQLVRLSEMPLYLQKAFVATEDDKFFDHRGVRPDAIINALVYTIQHGRTRGGSTITQQVVRNVESLGVGQERKLQRKIREAIVALQVEREFTKDEILELYLNQIFLGISAWGVESASWQYFGKSCTDLTLGEAATLAGLTRAPNAQEPIHHFDNALARRNVVLGQMLENGFISRKEYDGAVAEDLAASIITPEERAARRASGKGVWTPNQFQAPYFVEEVRAFMLDRFPKEEVFEDGLEVHTTLDMRLQRAAEEVLLSALDEFDAKKLKYLQARDREKEFTPVSGALVCIDNREPYQGWVRALVGGRDFQKDKFNKATQALRQPGSSVKPFVWALAINSGMTASTVVIDEPFEQLDGAGNVWRPKNFTGDFRGPMPIRLALEKSVNIVSIKLAQQLGAPRVISLYRNCGITTPIDNTVGLTIALGTPVVRVIDQCVAYSVFANGGARYDYLMVPEVRDRDGLVRYRHEKDDTGARSGPEQVMDPRVAFIMTHLMEGVARFGSGARSRALDRPRAGKTGTTNESRNVWFCGFTPDYTCVVWLGYDDNRPLGKGVNYTGGRLACPIWTQFMIRAHEGLPKRHFVEPDGIVWYNIDRETGVQGGNYPEAYLAEGPPPPTEWYGDLYPDTDGELDANLLEDL